MRRLRRPLVQEGERNFPIIPTSLVRGAVSTWPIQALIDTGSATNLFPEIYATQLGVQEHELAAGPSVEVRGVGGATMFARAAMVDLLLGGVERIRLAAVPVYFVRDLNIPFAALLGQEGFLDRVSFTQHGPWDLAEFVVQFDD